MSGSIVLSVAKTATGRNIDAWVRAIVRDVHGRHRECRYRVVRTDRAWSCSCGGRRCEHIVAVRAEVS